MLMVSHPARPVRLRNPGEIASAFFSQAVVGVALVAASFSQPTPESVKVDVHIDQPQHTFSPIWNYFGYDEPNYTYAPNGRKLLGELAALGPVPAYVRVR